MFAAAFMRYRHAASPSSQADKASRDKILHGVSAQEAKGNLNLTIANPCMLSPANSLTFCSATQGKKVLVVTV
jgi:hypothetical protein